MATTDHSQRIRGNQRYQDIIAVDALFKDIVQVVGLHKAQLDRGPECFDLDWLNYRLTIFVDDWMQGWDPHTVYMMEKGTSVTTVTCVNNALPSRHSCDWSTLLSLAQLLRLLTLLEFKELSFWVRTRFTCSCPSCTDNTIRSLRAYWVAVAKSSSEI
jgi:hypothetical protein